jgi:serine/threonine protein kinase
MGCVVKNSWITGLVLVKYKCTLEGRVKEADFDVTKRATCMRAVEEGIEHIHNLGLAHNDLSRPNIMLKEDDAPVIIDFDSCLPEGEKLSKGGLVGGWTGRPVAKFSESSKECDIRALEFIREWLSLADRAGQKI